MKKVEIIVGHINFYDHTEPSMNHATILKIGRTALADVDTAEEIAESMMDNEYQGYIIPDLYKGTIKYPTA